MDKQKNGVVLSDDEIIELYFARDEAAISETDIKYGKYLSTVAMNILKNHHDSEECLNDTYLRVWNSIPPTRPLLLRPYLAKIVRGISLNRYNKTKSGRRVPSELCEPFEEMEGFIPDGESSTERLAEIISDYLDEVSDRRLYVFVSRYYYAMPIAEISEKLSVSVSTVDKELAAVRAGLRKRLAKEGIKI